MTFHIRNLCGRGTVYPIYHFNSWKDINLQRNPLQRHTKTPRRKIIPMSFFQHNRCDEALCHTSPSHRPIVVKEASATSLKCKTFKIFMRIISQKSSSLVSIDKESLFYFDTMLPNLLKSSEPTI